MRLWLPWLILVAILAIGGYLAACATGLAGVQPVVGYVLSGTVFVAAVIGIVLVILGWGLPRLNR